MARLLGALPHHAPALLARLVAGACSVGLACSAAVALESATANRTEGLSPLGPEFALVVTGGELLDGTIPDSHTPFLARTLRPLGLHCVQVLVVDDSPADLKTALETASRRAALVLVTGGLGPTVNDITRDALSEFAGVDLVEDPRVLEQLGRRFGQAPTDLRANLRRQARIPASGSSLPNDHGTAVGLIFESTTTTLIALPGPPRELRPMVTDHLVPWLRQRLGLPARGASLTLRFVGIGQSAIDSTLQETGLLPARVVTASRFDGGRVDFTFSLPEDTPTARAELSRLSTVAAAELGDHLYSTNDTSLEEVVWSALEPLGSSLVLVETPGPFLAAAFAQAQLPSSASLISISAGEAVSLPRAVGLEAALPEDPAQRAEALGRAARSRTGAAWGLVLLESREVKADSGTIWVAWGHPDGLWETWSLGIQDSPESGRAATVTTVLDELRRRGSQARSQRIATPSTIR